MPVLNTAVRNSLADHRASLYDTATLKLDGDVVATYSITWNDAVDGEAVSDTASATSAIDGTFGASNGTLELSGPGGMLETLTAGGPGSGAEIIVQNDKQVPDGEIFAGKAVNISQIRLIQPAS